MRTIKTCDASPDASPDASCERRARNAGISIPWPKRAHRRPSIDAKKEHEYRRLDCYISNVIYRMHRAGNVRPPGPIIS